MTVAGLKVHPCDAELLQDVKILRARGLTMSQVAKRLGMSRATLYRRVQELS